MGGITKTKDSGDSIISIYIYIYIQFNIYIHIYDYIYIHKILYIRTYKI